MRALGSLLRLLFNLAAFVAFVGCVLKVFFVDVIVMPHNGMAPTLVYGEYLLVWRGASPDLGDIMVCPHPRKPEATVIGRAVGFAGHTISLDGRGQLMVDDDSASIAGGGPIRFYDLTREKVFNMQLGTIDYHRKHQHEFFIDREGVPFELPTLKIETGMFLLGDNRAAIYDDSRDFGTVETHGCQGEIFMRLAPGPDRNDDVHHGYAEFVH